MQDRTVSDWDRDAADEEHRGLVASGAAPRVGPDVIFEMWSSVRRADADRMAHRHHYQIVLEPGGVRIRNLLADGSERRIVVNADRMRQAKALARARAESGMTRDQWRAARGGRRRRPKLR